MSRMACSKRASCCKAKVLSASSDWAKWLSTPSSSSDLVEPISAAREAASFQRTPYRFMPVLIFRCTGMRQRTAHGCATRPPGRARGQTHSGALR